MKKVNPALLTIALIGFFLVSSTFTVQGTQNEGAWVLVNVIDIDGAEKIAKDNKDYEGVYHNEGSYSRNNYQQSSTYVGPSDDYYDPPQIHGEGASYSASFSAPPQVIYPDQAITISISLSGEVNNSYYNPTASVKAQIAKNDQSYEDFTNANGEGSFKSYVHNDFASFNETVTAIAPGGSEGETLEIRFYFSYAAKMETQYVYEWKEGDGPDPEIEQPTPTKCPADTEEKKLERILKLYTARIPKGKAKSGTINNTYALLGYSEYEKFACGGYQAEVLKLLDGLKFSKDPCERQLLDNWDYGPIQAYHGMHQAVVVYPKGNDWKHTGIVLDPWQEQIPKTYKIFDWAKRFQSPYFEDTFFGSGSIYGKDESFWYGIGPSDVYRETKAYPICGGDYVDLRIDDLKFTKEELRFIQSLTPEKRTAFKNMTKLRQKLWLHYIMQGQDKIQKVIAHCPLNLYLMDGSGNRSGQSGTEILKELPSVTFMILELTDGTNYTEITYPENAGYTLVLEGTDEGQAYVWQGHTFLLGETPPPVQQYSFSVRKGDTYQIATDVLGAPMQWEGGSLAPDSVTEISDVSLENLPGLVLPEPLDPDNVENEIYENYDTTENESKNFSNIWIFLLCGFAIFCFLLVVGLGIVFLVVKKKGKTNQ
jgi:hypothetical protein